MRFCLYWTGIIAIMKYCGRILEKQSLALRGGSKFSPDDGFLRRRFQKKHIIKAVSLYQSGLSLKRPL
jgi:hypothetical protein